MTLQELPPSAALLLVPAAILVVALAPNSEVTVDVSAVTERAEITIGTMNLRWYLEDVQVETDAQHIKHFSGHWAPEKCNKVTFLRAGTGPLTIEAQQGCAASTGYLSAQDVDQPLTGDFTIRVVDPTASYSRGNRGVFPFRGRISIGEELRSNQGGQAHLLEEGRLVLIGKSWFRQKEHFDALRHDLAPGDTVSSSSESDLGFVAVDADRALRVGFRTLAAAVEVRRYGTIEGRALTVPWTQRFLADPVLHMLMLVTGLFVGVAGVAMAWHQRWNGRTAAPAARESECSSAPTVSAAILLCVACLPGQSEIVRIIGGSPAQGITRPNREHCEVIAPLHAFEDGSMDQVEVLAYTGIKGRARLVRRLAPDIAILQVEAGLEASLCRDGAWPRDGIDVAPPQVEIRGVGPDGVMTVMPARIDLWSRDEIRLRPIHPSDAIMGKMSGSAIVSNHRIIGMLTSAESGRGIGLRISEITAIVDGQPAHQNSCQLSGLWSLVTEVGGAMRGGSQTLIRIEQEGPFVRAWLEREGPDLNEDDGWRAEDKIWDGELDGCGGRVTGYGRARPAADGLRQSGSLRRTVPFRVSGDRNSISTELVQLELMREAFGNARAEAMTRRVTLHRIRD